MTSSSSARKRTTLFCVVLSTVTLLGVSITSVAEATLSASATSNTSPAPGTRFRECAECPEMTVIPSGKFTMSRKSASDGRRDDDPEGIPKSAAARQVNIDAPFAIGIYDVTRDEFAAFVRESHRSTGNGCYIWRGGVWNDDKTKSWRNPGFPQTGRDPVVCVNWEDAQAYVEWLNGKVSDGPQGAGAAEGRYRLPSWEEAEYAAGGGSTTPYSWGVEVRRDRANYGADRCFPCRPAQESADRWLFTSPVGSFPPNAFGLYDMSGNVWQWTESCVHGSPSGMWWDLPGPNRRCGRTALHGGSWLEGPAYLRVGEYALNTTINRNQETGFRVARTLERGVSEPMKDKENPPVTDRVSEANIGVAHSLPLVPGKKFRDCPHCPEMIEIPRGNFMMGSPAAVGWDTREVPEHRVTIAKHFAVGIYDVTRAEYDVFVRKTNRTSEKGCDVVDPEARWITDPGRDWRNPGFHQTGRHPVVCVSWEDAQAYVRWLNIQVKSQSPVTRTGRDGPYRLLSEAEWEYAARAGSSTPYYWGSAASHDRANYGLEECYPCGVKQEGKDHWSYTSPVGSFAPNAFGLYDMSGNVWQWTEDCMHYGYVGAAQDGSVWPGGECKLHVLRGGSWLDPSILIAVTLRNPWTPDSRNQANGFRIARSLD
jgi:formylglycine-generating enzyme required for sulfatase activity